jgi:hypothetical protein
MSKTTLALLIALTLTTAAFAQSHDPIRAGRSVSADAAAPANKPNSGVAPAATSTCAYTFTSGGTATQQYLQTCVTVNGNIVEFQSPAGVEDIRVGLFTEGYAICDFTSGLGYHDYADGGDSDTGPGWGTPVLLSLTGTQVKISRTTLDGIWTLTQTFTQSAADASVKVTMALHNSTAVARFVWLTRVVDIDANSTFPNIADGTVNTAFGYQSSTRYGLQLSLYSANPFAHYGFATPQVNNACSIGSGYAGLLNGVDAVQYYYNGITVPKLGTKTVNLKYKGI